MDLLQTSKQNSLSLPKRLSALGLFLILPFFTMGQFAFEGPIPKITQGFGAFGNNAFTSEFFQLTPDSTYECSDTLRCIITYPTGLNSTRGTVFRFPGSSKLNESSYDLVIIDADFTNVQAYVDHALTLVKPRGSVIVAGALADDLVSDPAKRDDRTSAYRWLLKALEDRENVSHTLNMVGDGLVHIVRAP